MSIVRLGGGKPCEAAVRVDRGEGEREGEKSDGEKREGERRRERGKEGEKRESCVNQKAAPTAGIVASRDFLVLPVLVAVFVCFLF